MWKARQTWVKDRDDRNQQIREAPDVWARGTCGNMSTGPGEALWLTDLVHRAPEFLPQIWHSKERKGKTCRVSRILQEPTCSHMLRTWSLTSLFQKNCVESSAAALDTQGYVPRWHLQIWLYFIPYHVTENNNDSGQTTTSFIVQTNYNWQHICNM